jgi:hypothetical protein
MGPLIHLDLDTSDQSSCHPNSGCIGKHTLPLPVTVAFLDTPGQARKASWAQPQLAET